MFTYQLTAENSDPGLEEHVHFGHTHHHLLPYYNALKMFYGFGTRINNSYHIFIPFNPTQATLLQHTDSLPLTRQPISFKMTWPLRVPN